MTWLESLMKMTDEYESPKTFWKWSALASIAAIVKDNVWLDRGGAFLQYPNIYVMLLARSGLRKGPPINLAKRLVKKVNNTRIINGRSSIQAILKEMGTANTEPGGKVNAKSDAFVIASEMSASFVDDKATMDIFTDLYDRIYNEGEWKSLLKMETFILKDPIISMLLGTNEPHFKNFFQEKDVHGGFIGRMFVIAESKKHRSNSLIDDLENPLIVDSLVPHLKEIAKLRGPFASLSRTSAGEMYKKWYRELDEVYDQVEDKTGTLERVGESVIKVAMLLSLARCTELVINEDDMIQAIELCQRLVGNVRKHTMTQGSKQTFADQKNLIIAELMGRETHSISQEQLLKKFWMHFNIDQLTMIMQSFEAAGLILTESVGNKIIYQMPEVRFKELKRYMDGK
jgi:hypothetical protein